MHLVHVKAICVIFGPTVSMPALTMSPRKHPTMMTRNNDDQHEADADPRRIFFSFS